MRLGRSTRAGEFPKQQQRDGDNGTEQYLQQSEMEKPKGERLEHKQCGVVDDDEDDEVLDICIPSETVGIDSAGETLVFLHQSCYQIRTEKTDERTCCAMCTERVAEKVENQAGEKTYNQQPIAVDLCWKSEKEEQVDAGMNNP